jgi:uncharacterized protein (TIGR03437 family)
VTSKNKFRIAKFGLALAVVPILIQAYEFGPPPGAAGGPSDQYTNGCISSGCHSGTVNSGGGSVKASLPSGVTTYTPGGPAIPVSVLITDSMKSFGFELEAVSGSTGGTQAGDFANTTAYTQVACLDGSFKANGKSCPSAFPVQYIEHTQAGWSNSISTKGSYTYTFNWTPPATNVGNVTLYFYANCGTGTASVSPTHVYKGSLVLTPAAASTAPVISNVLDAASGHASIVPGEWVAIYGSNLAAATTVWGASDFNGNNLPTKIGGVTVNFGTLPASVFFVSSGQIDAQAPSGISGTVPVTVTNNGTVSGSFNATVAANAPTLFTYASGSNTFAAAQNVSFVTIGDPAVTPGTAKALPGQSVILYINGLGSSPSGTLISPAISYSGTVTATIGGQPATVTFAGLVGAGLFQVNATVPSGLTPGTYPVLVSTAGQTSQTGVLLPVGP